MDQSMKVDHLTFSFWKHCQQMCPWSKLDARSSWIITWYVHFKLVAINDGFNSKRRFEPLWRSGPLSISLEIEKLIRYWYINALAWSFMLRNPCFIFDLLMRRQSWQDRTKLSKRSPNLMNSWPWGHFVNL